MEWVSLFQGRDFIVMPFPDFNACRRFLHSWVFKQHSVPGGALKERKKCRNPLASIKAFYNIATPEWMAFWPEKGYGEKAQHKALGGNTGTRHKNMMITHKKGDYHECSLVAACCQSEKYHPQQKNWYPNLLTHISTPSPLIAALGYLSFCMHFLSPLLTGFFFFLFLSFCCDNSWKFKTEFFVSVLLYICHSHKAVVARAGKWMRSFSSKRNMNKDTILYSTTVSSHVFWRHTCMHIELF